MDKSFWLVDGNSILYRSYYAIGPLSTPDGQPSNAAYGFTTTLFKLIQERNPSHLAITFDRKEPTFRHKLFSDYKIQRPPMPEDLVKQIPLIKEIIKTFPIVILEKPGYEADDVLATMSRRAEKENLNTFIVTGDKDILQLVGEKIKVYNSSHGFFYDAEKVKEKFGISPENIVDLIALMGDASDNIPGVFGVGEKTAVKLIKEFGSIENLYKNIDIAPQSPHLLSSPRRGEEGKERGKKWDVLADSLREKLIKGKEMAFLSKKLAILDLGVPLKASIADCRMKNPDYQKLKEIFQRLEFKRLVKVVDELARHCEPRSLSGRGNLNEDFLLFQPGKIYRMDEILRGLESFKSRLEDPDTEKIGFHLKEKLIQLAKKGVEVKGELFDLGVAEYLLNEKSPSPLILSPLGRGREGEGGIRTLRSRCLNDLQGKNLLSLFKEVEMPLIKVLAKMEMKGIFIDTGYLSSLSKKFGEKLKDLEREIYLASGEEFKINSPDQLRKILFEKLKLPPGKRTKKGYSTDSEVLKELSRIHHLPATLLEYRQLYKLKSTYIDALPKLVSQKDKRLHTSFNQIGTTTGRFSSSDPNLQNIPIRTERGSLIRKAFCAEGDYFLFSFDYSQIELRVLAHLSEDPSLREAFLNNRDIHAETASLIFNRETSPSLSPSPQSSPTLSLPLRWGGKKGGGKNRGGGITPEMRRIGKTVNFAVLYGMSGFGLAKELEIKREKADEFIRCYFEKYGRVKEYFQGTLEKAMKDIYVSTILGRRRYLPDLKSKNPTVRKFAERAAINMPVQGSSADILKLAMVKIEKDLTKNNLKSMMILTIHDELLFEGPEEEEEKLTKIVEDDMLNIIPLSVPIKVEIKKGKNWLDLTKIEN